MADDRGVVRRGLGRVAGVGAMTKFQQAALSGLGTAMVVFLAFAFAAWDINPGNWEPSRRAFCAFIMATFAVSVFAGRMGTCN